MRCRELLNLSGSQGSGAGTGVGDEASTGMGLSCSQGSHHVCAVGLGWDKGSERGTCSEPWLGNKAHNVTSFA